MVFLTNWIIPLLLYSGPFLTFGLVLIFYPTPKRIKFYKISSAVHLAAFMPFVFLAITKAEDYIYSLMIPAITGSILFVGGVAYLTYLKFRRQNT